MTFQFHPSERIHHQVPRETMIRALQPHLPAEGLLWEESELRPYECDGLYAYQQVPWLVALPETEAQVRSVLIECHTRGVPVVARGAGTGLSGGALPLDNGVLLSLARLNRILEIDPENRTARVEPGVTNASISQAAAEFGLYYAPDPSSQIACSIGGNVAENAGGVHCLKYGLTVHNIQRLKFLTIEGEEVVVGGAGLEGPGLDLLALMTGSEGMLGVVTEITVKLLPVPESARVLLAAFDDIGRAADAVAAIIRAGLVPAGLEMMDRFAIHAVEDFMQVGYPLEAEAILLCEVDGPAAQVEDEVIMAKGVLEQAGAFEVRVSRDAEERRRFWAGRKAAFPAMGKITPDYYCMDGTIPRHRLAEVLAGIARLSEKYQLKVANVFHAGDGNLHPLIIYDGSLPGALESTEQLGAEILELCIQVGGTITGEHGVGIEKINQMCIQFGVGELHQFQAVKKAFDPKGLLNPGKAVPTLARCAEFGAMHVHKGQLLHPELERF
ncbi:MAG: glycolate oxidase subunit GlcD [Methylothermaceae bacteria B42]|nr:MAG: glycolate oxidase subunit GlcD [Methylothermaceae bacteria B42]HHJ39833.1 FAD-binding protein [Methylothermaceae bacterium]